MPDMIEVALKVSTTDEGLAASLAERLARIAVGMTGEPGVQAWIDVDRIPMCRHEHDEVGP